MAVILKNQNINAAETRKLKYENNEHVSPMYEHAADDFVANSYHEIEDVVIHREDEKSISNTADVNDIVVLEDRVIYQNAEYYSQSLIDVQVEHKINEHLTAIEQQKESIMHEARKEGYSEGLKLADERYHEKLNELNTLIGNISTAFSAKMDENIDIIRDIIFIALSKIIGETLKNDKSRIDIINNVINTISANNPYTLKLSRHDYEIIKSHPEYLENYDSIQIQSDNRVSIGGCIIETEAGTFDGRLEVQLARLKEVIESK